MTNSDIARRLLTHARELEAEGGNIYRARAYRTSAAVVERMLRPVSEVVTEEGRAGLEAVPGIGKSVAYSIETLVKEGELKSLNPADSGREPDRLFGTLPGVGPKLAEKLRDVLGLKTLEELYSAAQEGRLAEVGVGPKRLSGIVAALEQRMGPIAAPVDEPELEDLLEMDRQYREGMDDDRVPRIAPRHFNPEGERWLGVARNDVKGWKMKALFSNTALAHRVGRTRDWVVIYFERGHIRGQRTVVTETKGELIGRRVVRGRERECRALYQVGSVTSEPAA